MNEIKTVKLQNYKTDVNIKADTEWMLLIAQCNVTIPLL
ncbi:hypothetical protein CAter10_2129 [Collimonas arenae]|nr:hypothetical protein CAter10_2129 [Collimonas arenae]